jgi:hypothetical protein
MEFLVTASLNLLAEMPKTGAEVILWLATAAGLVLFHTFLNAALAPKKPVEPQRVRPV